MPATIGPAVGASVGTGVGGAGGLPQDLQTGLGGGGGGWLGPASAAETVVSGSNARRALAAKDALVGNQYLSYR